MIQIVVSAHRTVSKNMEKRLDELEIKERIEITSVHSTTNNDNDKNPENLRELLSHQT